MSIAIETKVETKIKLQAPKKYNIWAIDNDQTAFDEVVFILVQAFSMTVSVASELTCKIDIEGKAKVNPKPMSKGLAQAQLDKINTIKRGLSQMNIFRKKEVMMLKFTIKED